jgi:hypothetical protein
MRPVRSSSQAYAAAYSGRSHARAYYPALARDLKVTSLCQASWRSVQASATEFLSTSGVLPETPDSKTARVAVMDALFLEFYQTY